ncbi:hypothetical protein [Desulfotalea psychrophila]|uniref:Uncharacterized protein n=1 Tax=Desulfotalea psychrophila (strain LSv54 / DSM 12343) TaxID=177439 RepID=Q6AKX7_DESPS|nr:hypothetical protein [Desulfotalea psychrophila]CAG36998.1 unknown protein [Desulfotalea psychrophila LSv54]
MQTMVKELKLLLPFKETTEVGDIILIVAKEPQILQYAVVTGIDRDDSRKDEWWHVHFSFLSIPLQKASWTLRTDQMTGQEIFTMGGEERFVQAVDVHEPEQSTKLNGSSQGGSEKKPAPKKGGLRRIK